MKKEIPAYQGTLRSHTLSTPKSTYACSGIAIFGRRIKSLVFSTDVATIANINTDAVIAVYPFTPQPKITQAIISVSDVPVFVGVGGGLTSGERAVRMAIEAEDQGAYGVVVNAPMPGENISKIKKHIELPVIATIVSPSQDVEERLRSGADILNISGGERTPELVKQIRQIHSSIPIIATGGPTDESIYATINAGANAISYTPPNNSDILSTIMKKYRSTF